MLRVILCVLLAVGAFSFPPKTNPLRDSGWEMFKLTYNKVYSLSEEFRKRVAWENNLDVIEKHNAEYKNGKHTYTLGVNAYADLTSQEFVRQMNGYRMDLKKPSGATFVSPSSLGDLPNTVDWRTKGYVTGVKDQKACGGCWAFSATGSLEGQHFRKNHTLVSMSEQNLIDCSRDLGNMGCEGGLMNLAFEYIRINVGIDTEVSYPFIAMDGRCNFSRANVAATDVGFIDIKKNSEDDLKTAVATVGPISVAIDASEQTFQLYHSGVYNQPKCSTTQLDHAVLAVGYGVFNGTDYWLVKNSWGTSWGMDGYIMMSRNKGNQCGIAGEASYPRVFGHPPREV